MSLPLLDPYKTTEQSGGWVLHRDEYILEKIQYISYIQTQINWSIQYFYLIPQQSGLWRDTKGAKISNLL